MLLFDTGKKLEKAVGEEAAAIIMQVLEQYDEKTKDEVATKGDLREESNSVRSDLRQTELRLQADIEKIRTEIKSMELRLLKWQIAGYATMCAVMAKGFGWLGF